MNDSPENTHELNVDYVSKTTDRPSTLQRLSSMFLDHLVMTLIIVPPMIVISLTFEERIETIAFYFMILVYLNKDFVRGKSIGKRIVGLQVINCQNGQPANEMKCFLRNLTIPIWPLEVLVTLFSSHRRLGDIIANTRIEPVEKENVISILSDLKEKKFSATTFLTLTIGVGYMGVLWYLLDGLIKI